MRNALLLALLTAAACAHAPARRGHATARLIALEVQPGPRGELRLGAKYQLDGLPFAAWHGRAAQLSISLDDAPFASVVAQPTLLPGDALVVPISLAFPRPPREVAGAWARGVPVRVRLTGELSLEAPGEVERVPTDVEQALILPPGALPAPRG